MAERPPYSGSYDHLNQGFPQFTEGSAISHLQGGDHLDQYFPNGFAQQSQPNFVPQNHFYENINGNLVKPPDNNNEYSGPFYPYFRDPHLNNHAPQSFNGQNRNHNFVKLPEENQYQAPNGNIFPVNVQTNPCLSFNQGPPGTAINQYVPFCPNPESSEQAQTDTNGFEEGEESDYDSEVSKKSGGIMQYKSVLKSKIWDEEMDELLLKLGAQYKCNWKRIAKKYNHKKITPAFIKMRYKELSSEAPMTRRTKFTHREDLMIAKYFDKFGSNWTKMAEFFPDRTAIMLKNRYYSFIRKRDVLDLLLSKAINLESKNIIVDDLDTPESQKYTECIDLKMESFEFTQKSKPNQEGQLVFGFEGIKPAVNVGKSPESTGDQQTFDRDLEIKFLQARLKSLQTLYLRTKTQLSDRKTNKSKEFQNS